MNQRIERIGRRLAWLALVVVAILLLVVSAVARADDGSPPDSSLVGVPALVDALRLIAEGVGAGFVLAFLAERFEWFQKLAPNAKWWVIFCVMILSPVLAQVLLDFVPADVWSQIEPYWRALALGFVGWAGSQAVHLGQKALVKLNGGG